MYLSIAAIMCRTSNRKMRRSSRTGRGKMDVDRKMCLI